MSMCSTPTSLYWFFFIQTLGFLVVIFLRVSDCMFVCLCFGGSPCPSVCLSCGLCLSVLEWVWVLCVFAACIPVLIVCITLQAHVRGCILYAVGCNMACFCSRARFCCWTSKFLPRYHNSYFRTGDSSMKAHSVESTLTQC